MNITVESINKAYAELKSARRIFHNITDELVSAKRKLALVEADAVRKGLEGSNKQKRDAELAEIVKAEADAVIEAEHEKGLAQFTLTLAEDEVRRVRLLVRFDDIATRQIGDKDE